MNNIMKFYYGQDGDKVDPEVLENFQFARGDIKYIKKEDITVYDFVGFLINKFSMLIVLPKHFYQTSEVDKFNDLRISDEENFKLLFEVIQKYINKKNHKSKADKYIGKLPIYETNYPFEAFYKIYDYYRRYGLYKEVMIKSKQGYNGKVSWKDVLNKSQVIINDGNIIFSPLYVKQKNHQFVFLSECMAFVIDNTLKMFPFFFTLPKTNYGRTDFNFFDNTDFVIRELLSIKSKLFKDIHLTLVDSLIVFFKEYKSKSSGGNLHVKINYFNSIWEDMVNDYLNKAFSNFDSSANCIIFDDSLIKSTIQFEKKKFVIDNSDNNHFISVDHYAEDELKKYIFDSKYYVNIKELNYKQLSYNELLRYYKSDEKKAFSVLLFPGDLKPSTHFEFMNDYVGVRSTNLAIVEQYLNVRELMKSYLKMA